MTNKEILKKKIIFRSMHRGTKEMDLLLGNFVKKYIEEFSDTDLKDLQQIVFMEDEILQKWYFERDSKSYIPDTKVSKMLKNFKP